MVNEASISLPMTGTLRMPRSSRARPARVRTTRTARNTVERMPRIRKWAYSVRRSLPAISIRVGSGSSALKPS